MKKLTFIPKLIFDASKFMKNGFKKNDIIYERYIDVLEPGTYEIVEFSDADYIGKGKYINPKFISNKNKETCDIFIADNKINLKYKDDKIDNGVRIKEVIIEIIDIENPIYEGTLGSKIKK